MPTPQFVLDLRAHIGTAPLWLMGATAIVLRDGTDGREILLVKRSDSGRWAPISGIVDPGENPAQTAVREAAEEASVQIEVERMVWMGVTRPVTYANGDQCQYLDHGFRARWVGGEAQVGDEESTAVGWFPVDALPEPAHYKLHAVLQLVLDDPADVVLDDPWEA